MLRCPFARAEPSVLLEFWAASLVVAGASEGRSCWGPSGKASAGWASTMAFCSTTVFTGIMHGVVDFLLLAMMTTTLGDQQVTACPIHRPYSINASYFTSMQETASKGSFSVNFKKQIFPIKADKEEKNIIKIS